MLRELFSRKKTCSLIVNVEGKVVEKYQHFKDFLTYNHDALNSLAELEQTYYAGSSISMGSVKSKLDKLLESTRKLIGALEGISSGKYSRLADVCDRIEREISQFCKPEPLAVTGRDPLVLPFEQITPDMARLAGSKATNLANIGNALGAPIPQGFAITAPAFERFLDESGLGKSIEELLAAVTSDMTEEMEATCKAIQNMILTAEVPSSVTDEIRKAYDALEAKTIENVRIAVRSSAVGEDTEASFAGQYTTVLNVTRDNLLDAYKSVVASKYAPGAVLYRLNYGLDDRDAPMCVAAVVMVDSKSSGVLYTADPSLPGSPYLKISSIWGLGERLVSGEASPDIFHVDRRTNEITQRSISRKENRLISLQSGGVLLDVVPEEENALPSISDETARVLARYGLMLEEHFNGPQDVEWALDRGGRLYILQCRPLGLTELTDNIEPQTFPNHPILLSGGKTASRGTATGVVFMAGHQSTQSIPEGSILVAKTASPDYAKLIGKARGIITDIGSTASHLASVAREFGVPAIFDTKSATSSLVAGETVTMMADSTTVYRGMVAELAANPKQARKHFFESPMHRRMRAMLDRISPLNLTGPKETSFSIDGCRTIHDIIRFSHECVIEEMFSLAGEAGSTVTSVVLRSTIPLMLRLIDLGEGLREGLTTCDTIIPDHIESIPLKALWSGFSHPGISWSGSAVGLSFSNLMTLAVAGATSNLEEVSTWDSYAVVSKEYLNMSVRFGYHFAGIDAFCSDEPTQNHVSLQFSGGAGSYYGRSLRIAFLSNVLDRLGFNVEVVGDLLEAALSGYDMKSMENILDQVGRLLASSRLLDMAIPGQGQVNSMTEAFFREDYDYQNNSRSSNLPGFYTHAGDWRVVDEDGRKICLHDGSRWVSGISTGLAGFMGKMVGVKYQEFLDSVGAYSYFPMAVAKGSIISEGGVEVLVKPVAGSIDRAGGLIFGLKDFANYFVLRADALEEDFALFELVNDKRFRRATVHNRIETAKWHRIRVEISGHSLRGYLDGELLIGYTAERSLEGHIGIWTKADSVAYFDALTLDAKEGKRVIDPSS